METIEQATINRFLADWQLPELPKELVALEPPPDIAGVRDCVGKRIVKTGNPGDRARLEQATLSAQFKAPGLNGGVHRGEAPLAGVWASS